MYIGIIAIFSVLFATDQVSADSALTDPQRIEASRKVVAEFAAELQGELMKAIQRGGPKAAISVCRAIAPEIALRASERTGWDVGRTSLRLRNPNNKPDAWEEKVLREFETQKAAGKALETMEYAERLERDGKSAFRYMKAIGVLQPCLSCHGQNVAPDVKHALAELYSEDRATGYALGDVRGAFSVTQRLNE